MPLTARTEKPMNGIDYVTYCENLPRKPNDAEREKLKDEREGLKARVTLIDKLLEK